jgi:hypothetical protein
MPADVPAAILPDSRPLYQVIRRTRRLLRSSWVVTGLGLSAGLLFGTLVALTLIDLTVPLRPYTWTVAGRVVPIDSLIRLAALLLVVVPAAWAFLVGVVRPLFRRMAAVHVARRIESHLPGIHNRLVSCIDLEARGSRADVSPVFYRRLLTEALERVRGFRPGVVLDFLSLRKATLFAAATALSFLLMWGLFSDRVPRAMARVFLPFADLPPASAVAYTVEPGDAGVLREEPIPFAVKVTSEADPEELHLELYNDAGLPPHRYDLVHDKQDPKIWKYTIDGSSLGAGYEDGFRYRVYGGGTWSVQKRIRLVERPVLVAVGTAVYYPAYMGIPEPHPTTPQAVEVTGPEGGEVEVRVAAQGQVAAGEVQILRPAKRPIARKDQAERAWFEDKLPFGAEEAWAWTWERRDGRTVHVDRADVGVHGHGFQKDPVGHAVSEGDVLFVYVNLPERRPPEAVILEWFDGETWAHQACWGADRLRQFGTNRSLCRSMGDLPALGRWVRLEVPASRVGLEGKTLRGMNFRLYGGECAWGRAGTVRVEEFGVEVMKTYPMRQVEEGAWSGRFPLVGAGLFRAELRNAQGHPNKPMKELKYAALPDRPPQVLLERQSTEMVLSKPAAVPLAVKAFDDYGLAEINVLVRDGENAPYRSRTLERLATPKRDVSLVAPLTEAAALKQGGVLRYLAEAKDRKGQTGRTREYVVRVAADPAAADQQLTQFEKTQDTFRDRLVQLIAEQKKVQGQIEKLNKEYAALTEKVQAQADRQPQETGKATPQPGPKDKVHDLKLDPETAKRLAELQKELAKLGKQEEQNTNLAQQISNDLAKAAEQAGKLEMLPQPVADQMQATQQMFQNMVADAMRDLGRRMSQGADPKQTPAPDLKDLQQRGDRIQKEMEGIKNRLDALANARKGMREDLREALRQLQRDLLNETGKMTARELEQLRDFLAQMRERMKELQDRQEELMKDALEGKNLKGLKEKQEDLDKQIEKMLARARHLLDSKKRDRDRPEFPDSPYTPDAKEVKVPPREEDTDEPLPNRKDKSGKNKPGDKDDKKAGDKNEDDKEPLYMPALGGPKQKIDPRFAKKRRPVKPTAKDGKDDPDDQRGEMEDRQNDQMRDLQAARDSLGSDQQALEQMLKRLAQATPSKGKSGKGQPSEGESEADQLARQLQEMMQSPAMRAAMAMASRMRQGPPPPGRPQQGQPGQTSQGDLSGGPKGGSREADLSKLDPDTRAIILKLPPSRLRDEMIQGMNEQGPEAYRAFIQDYFKRLTDTKPAGK